MKESWQVVLAGEGGQGLVVAGILLGEAAVLDGKNAAQTASYGIASRGGLTSADVVISDGDIAYPAVEDPDIVVALSRDALLKFYGKVSEECVIIYDSSLIDGDFKGKRVFGLPLSEKVAELRKEKGLRVALNVLSLGALSGRTGVVPLGALEEAVKKQFKRGFEANREALEAGFNLARNSCYFCSGRST
jgi:2-oxoglutarate ferredoxin oxidoreductase subunit gamma